MGWVFRKHIGIGRFLRLNLSKKGVGVSLGVPGYRISLGADKKIRRTISIPGTGLYNTEVIGSMKKSSKNKQPQSSMDFLCPNCNKKVDITKEYCTQCGTRIK